MSNVTKLPVGSIISQIKKAISKIPDPCLKRRSSITLQGCLMSCFAIFNLKFKSLLQFQEDMRSTIISENLRKLFGIEQAPSDTYLREVLDDVEPESLRPAFKAAFSQLERTKILERFSYLDDHYLLAIDGTGFFSSKKVHCEHCCVKNHKDGTKTYHHQMLCASIVHPSLKEVIPFPPEPIQLQDGTAKNDYELAAARRLLEKFKREHPHLKVIVIADSLYPNGPFIKFLESHGFSYILGAKQLSKDFNFIEPERIETHEIRANYALKLVSELPNDDGIEAGSIYIKKEGLRLKYTNKTHEGKIVKNEWLECVRIKDDVLTPEILNMHKDEILDELTNKNHTLNPDGSIHKFNWVNQLGLNGSHLELPINLIDYEETSPKGKIIRFTWVTNIALNKGNVCKVMKGGRARWKIENETFNTLKNQGYQFEHNFGHGNKNLSTVFAYMMMLAFLVDQISQLGCKYFQKALKISKRKKYFWEYIRSVFLTHVMETWEILFEKLCEIRSPATSNTS